MRLVHKDFHLLSSKDLNRGSSLWLGYKKDECRGMWAGSLHVLESRLFLCQGCLHNLVTSKNGPVCIRLLDGKANLGFH